MGPGLVFGVLFASVADRGSNALSILGQDPLARRLWVGAALVVIVGIVIALLRATRRSGRELERLKAMRESYRHERESTAQ
jgi:hypothetical protein